ncbi:MAG: TolC family protein [Sedimentisphaerales bacterium]
MKRQLLMGFITLAVLCQICSADVNSPDSNNLRTLDDYLDFASSNNAELKASFEEWTAALEQIPQAKALPDPVINYGKYVRESDMQMGQAAGLMQTFPWLGKIEAQTDAASANAKAARQRFEAAKLSLYRQVKKEFYEFLYLKEAIDIARQNLELIKHFEQVALTKYTTATGTHPDIIRAQIELAKLDEILVSLKELKKPQVARLNAILNRPAEANLDWPQKPAISKLAMNFNQLINLLREKNPQLAELDWMIESARNEVKLAQKKFYPDIGVGVEWSQFDKSGGNSGQDSVALVFQMNIPLWRDSYKAAEQQAKANVRKATQQKIEAENSLASQVAGVLYEIEESQRQMHLHGDILVPKAGQLVNASETAYKAGTIDFLSLIDAQRMLLEHNLDYQRAITDNQQKLAELEMLIGMKVSTIKGEIK